MSQAGVVAEEVSLEVRRFPSLKRRGGRDINENSAKPPLKGADGVVRPAESSGLIISPNRPPRLRGTKVASRRLIDRAATPPFQGGECSATGFSPRSLRNGPVAAPGRGRGRLPG